jgi:molybdopterin molybdotransferase
MLTFEEARALVLSSAPELGTERVPLEAALGRVLAEALTAAMPLPPHDYSAMDGYAVSTAGLRGDAPWELPVRGESRTGRVAPPFSGDSLCRIFTGAPMPQGADAVVIQEDVERAGDLARFSAKPSPGQHVRRAGEDLKEGATALPAGTRLGPYQLGLAAAVDRADVVVSRKPRLTIVSTGDELRKPGSLPRPATIPESNGVAIAAMATLVGAEARLGTSSSDEQSDTERLLRAALDVSDVVVTIGGVSVGDYDVVRPALEAAGVSLDFYKVAIKPGKPLTVGRRGSTMVLGLPGNPVSAQVTFALFGLPLLRRMQGELRTEPSPRAMRLGAPVKQREGRRGYYAARIENDIVTPLPGQASGSTTSLAWADALIVVPQDSTGYEAGATVEVLLLADI